MTATWQTILAQAITCPQVLCDTLSLDPTFAADLNAACKGFPLRVPQPFVSRMEVGNPTDPLLLQVLPQTIETKAVHHFSADPLQESHHNPTPGLLHKYHGRVLFTLSGACAVNCRYCFRRHFPYEENSVSKTHWQNALAYIQSNSSITEVILSGGDPLIHKDKKLQQLVEDLAALPQLTTLRIHTRLPIVIPDRITDDLTSLLCNTRLHCVCVMHVNHANEIDEAVIAACQKLKQANVTLLNQAVLLKGVNNTLDDQINLSKRLFSAGLLPYYLHLLDPVSGSAHFDTDIKEAKALHAGLLANLPGYLVPRMVKENPYEQSKTPFP